MKSVRRTSTTEETIKVTLKISTNLEVVNARSSHVAK